MSFVCNAISQLSPESITTDNNLFFSQDVDNFELLRGRNWSYFEHKSEILLTAFINFSRLSRLSRLSVFLQISRSSDNKVQYIPTNNGEFLSFMQSLFRDRCQNRWYSDISTITNTNSTYSEVVWLEFIKDNRII